MKKNKEDNFLLYIPKRKHEYWKVENEKVYLEFYHNKPVEKFMRWLVKKPKVSDIELDALGSAVWQLLDGEKTVYEVGEKLIELFGEGCQPVYERLIMYLRYLNKKGWISFKRGNQDGR